MTKKSKSELIKDSFCDKLKCIVGACDHSPESSVCLYWKLIDKGTDELYKYIVKEFNKTVRSLENVMDNAGKPVVERTKAKTNTKTKGKGVKETKRTRANSKGVAKTRSKVSKVTDKKVK